MASITNSTAFDDGTDLINMEDTVVPIKNEPMDRDDDLSSAGSSALDDELNQLQNRIHNDLDPRITRNDAKLSGFEEKVRGLTAENARLKKNFQTIEKAVQALRTQLNAASAGSRMPWTNTAQTAAQAALTEKVDNIDQASTGTSERVELHDKIIEALAKAFESHKTRIESLEAHTTIFNSVRILAEVTEEKVSLLEQQSVGFEDGIASLAYQLDQLQDLTGVGSAKGVTGTVKEASWLLTRLDDQEKNISRWARITDQLSKAVNDATLAKALYPETENPGSSSTADPSTLMNLAARVQLIEQQIGGGAPSFSPASRAPDTKRRMKATGTGSPVPRSAILASTRGGRSSRGQQSSKVHSKGGTTPRDRGNAGPNRQWQSRTNGIGIPSDPLVDLSEPQTVQETPKNFVVDEIRVNTEAAERLPVYNKYAHAIMRMSLPEEIHAVRERVDVALSRAPPHSDLHQLDSDQLLSLSNKVAAQLRRYAVPDDKMGGVEDTSEWK